MKYNDLEKYIQRPIFSRQDLLLFGLTVFDYQLSLWVKKGYLLKLRNGLYVFAREMERLKKEEVACVLYEPAYISLESALSHYGFIPEMVYATVSVTARINRTFDNCFGRFIYRHVKRALFWGYKTVHTESGFYLLAEPEKALLDYFYLNLGHINSPADVDGLRLNTDQLRRHLDVARFKTYMAAFGVKKLERWASACLP